MCSLLNLKFNNEIVLSDIISMISIIISMVTLIFLFIQRRDSSKTYVSLVNNEVRNLKISKYRVENYSDLNVNLKIIGGECAKNLVIENHFIDNNIEIKRAYRSRDKKSLNFLIPKIKFDYIDKVDKISINDELRPYYYAMGDILFFQIKDKKDDININPIGNGKLFLTIAYEDINNYKYKFYYVAYAMVTKMDYENEEMEFTIKLEKLSKREYTKGTRCSRN